MKPERYNIFNKSHKGLDRLVSEAGVQILKCDFRNNSEIKECVRTLLQATRYYIYHIQKEDRIIYRAIESSAPYIIVLMEEINEKGLSLAASIEEKITRFNSVNQEECMINLGIELQASIFSFNSVVLQHIKKEETVLNELLWEKFMDCQLLELEVKMMIDFHPEEKKWFNSQVMKWLKDDEIADWIDRAISCGNSNGADLLIKTTKSVLSESRWKVICQHIGALRA
jgi:hypothetical protein